MSTLLLWITLKQLVFTVRFIHLLKYLYDEKTFKFRTFVYDSLSLFIAHLRLPERCLCYWRQTNISLTGGDFISQK